MRKLQVLGLLALLPLLGAASVLRTSDPVLEAGTPSAALTRALDTIEADEISADLHFLASDEMRGRDTPSQEQRIAARYIAARLERLGWKPGAQDGWFWDYELPTSSLDTESSFLRAERGGESLELQVGVDYAFHPRSMSESETLAEAVVFAGELTEDEVEGLDLEGRWVLCRSSADVGYRKISRTIREHDAEGVIVLSGSDVDGEAMQVRVASWGAQVLEPRLTRGRSNRRAPAFLYMSDGGARKLLGLAGLEEPKLGDVLEVSLHEKRSVTKDATAGLENVIGIWPGRDEELSKELIILSAHYDHVGTDDQGEVFNGADDNGSGTVGLLAVAESLAAYGPMRRSVMLIWVSGEEKGLLGSKAWTQDPYLPGGLKPVLNINIDMIGRNAPDSLLVTPTKEHDAYNGLTRLAESLAPEEGFPQLGDADAYWGRSDHANFSRNMEIPVAFLFSDIHEDYHKITDTPDKVDCDKVRRVARLVVRMLHGLQTDALDL